MHFLTAGDDFCINEKLEKEGRVRHLNLGFESLKKMSIDLIRDKDRNGIKSGS